MGPGLPASFRAVYGGDWRRPADGPLPYVCMNFCMSRDRRVSFSEPGHLGGGDVSGFDERHRWLMGLLRARAAAVMVGDGMLKAEPDYVLTPAAICPAEAAAFAALREAEGASPSHSRSSSRTTATCRGTRRCSVDPTWMGVVARRRSSPRPRRTAKRRLVRHASKSSWWERSAPTWAGSLVCLPGGGASARSCARAGRGSTARCCGNGSRSTSS